MSCSGGGSGSDGGGTWAFPCLTNLVPPKWAGWPKKSTVNVYIDNSYWNSAQLLAICEGITSWSVANLNSYSCHNASAPIATGNYIWVVYNPSFLDPLSGMPMGKNNNFGSGRAVQHSIITLGPFDNLQGAAAHEEGHNNFLDNCPACKLGGSLMGSQPTWSTFQPNTPTPCDLAWYAIWSL
jgi:hypothetical protein